PPRVDAPYDYEQPKAGQIFAVPESPPLILPDDWEERVRSAGAVTFRCTPDRAATLANLKEALRARDGGLGEMTPEQRGGFTTLLDLDPEKLGAFFGVGLGFLVESTLSDAMEHENLLETADFWQEVQNAAAVLAGLPTVAITPL